MALDATIAGADADSYITVAEADTMAASVGLATWATKTVQEREEALRRAAQDIDAHHVHDPAAAKTTQALLFPRKKDNVDGVDFIQSRVQWAQLYQADWIVQSGESDKGMWEGANAGPIKDAGGGSPLCPRAFVQFAPFISRVGAYKD